MSTQVHRQTLEETSTQVGGEARMLLPGVQTLMGFQLMAVFNQRFELFSAAEQVAHFVAFLLVTLTMGLLMAPAAYHRQAERRIVTERFLRMSSRLLSVAMVPFTIGVCLDTYLLGRIILNDTMLASASALGMLIVLTGLWFGLPLVAGPRR